MAARRPLVPFFGHDNTINESLKPEAEIKSQSNFARQTKSVPISIDTKRQNLLKPSKLRELISKEKATKSPKYEQSAEFSISAQLQQSSRIDPNIIPDVDSIEQLAIHNQNQNQNSGFRFDASTKEVQNLTKGNSNSKNAEETSNPKANMNSKYAEPSFMHLPDGKGFKTPSKKSNKPVSGSQIGHSDENNFLENKPQPLISSASLQNAISSGLNKSQYSLIDQSKSICVSDSVKNEVLSKLAEMNRSTPPQPLPLPKLNTHRVETNPKGQTFFIPKNDEKKPNPQGVARESAIHSILLAKKGS